MTSVSILLRVEDIRLIKGWLVERVSGVDPVLLCG